MQPSEINYRAFKHKNMSLTYWTWVWIMSVMLSVLSYTRESLPGETTPGLTIKRQQNFHTPSSQHTETASSLLQRHWVKPPLLWPPALACCILHSKPAMNRQCKEGYYFHITTATLPFTGVTGRCVFFFQPAHESVVYEFIHLPPPPYRRVRLFSLRVTALRSSRRSNQLGKWLSDGEVRGLGRAEA